MVDDASPVPIAPKLTDYLSLFPALVLIRNEENLGFASSCNRGAQVARGSQLLFLNNDAEALAGWWPPLREIIETRPEVGIVAPKLIFSDGTIQHCGKVWKDTAIANAQPQHIYYKMAADTPCVEKSRAFSTVTGACILVRRHEFMALGGFDEYYRNGWEDDDLCAAYRARGQRAWYCAKSVLIHHQGTTLDQSKRSPANQEEAQRLTQERFSRNRAHFFSKWRQYVQRDDYRYYREDGFARDPDIPRYAPELRQILGRPFEEDPGAASSMASRVSIIILTWNQLHLTKQCVASIQSHTPEPHEVIFVDNGSTDGTVPWLKSLLHTHPHYHLIENLENQGFAKGCNQGAATAVSDYLLFLNNDTMATAGWLAPLLEVMQSPLVGAAGCKLLYPDGLIQHAGVALINGIPDHPYRHYPANSPETSTLKEVDMVTGACLVIPRALFLRLGGFDEIYRNGVEDVDLCLRVREAGHKVVYQPETVVYHYEGQSAGRFDHTSKNLALFFARWQNRFSETGQFIPATIPVVVPAEASQLLARIVWQGSQFVSHSLALVNREFCLQLIDRGHELSIIPYETHQFGTEADPRFKNLEQCFNRPLSAPPHIHVRHQWPPDFTPPAAERWVMIQPWEFGSLPQAWIEPMKSMVDEIWAYTTYVRDCYIRSGIPGEKVHVIPLGVDTARFSPAAIPFPLATTKRFRFLFVGGTIHRKGVDILLNAYAKAFTANDDVCLVIKDMGGDSFYRGQTAREMIARFQLQPLAPAVEYIDQIISQDQLAGLYTACHCLVHPYRGEGFGLPIAEGMACGLPAIFTGHGAALDFCSPITGWLIPAKEVLLPEQRIGDIPTIASPWLAEPDLKALVEIMRHVYRTPAEVTAKGQLAATHIRTHFTWQKAADRMEQRIMALRHKSTPSTGADDNNHAQTAATADKLVSIIVGTRQDSPSLSPCLTNIQQHTPEPYELIIVSTDPRTGETVVKRNNPHAANGDQDQQLAVEPSLVAGYNKAITETCGTYIMLLDASVTVTAEWLSGIMECHATTSNAGIAGPLSNHGAVDQVQGHVDFSASDNLAAFAAAFRANHRYRRIHSRSIAHSCMLFKRELLWQIGPLDAQFGSLLLAAEDLCVRTAIEGYENVIAGDVLVLLDTPTGEAPASPDLALLACDRKHYYDKWSQPVTDPVISKKIATLKALENANYHYLNNDVDQAVMVLLHEGIKHNPDDPRLYLTLANYLLDADRPQDALDVLGEAPADRSFARQILSGNCLVALGRLNEAKHLAANLSGATQVNSAALTLYGLIYRESGAINKAIDFFQQAIATDPGNGEPYAHLGLITQQNGDLPASLAQLEQGFMLSPLRPITRNRYHSLVGNADAARGIKTFLEAHHCHPASMAITFLLIDLLIKDHRHEAAMDTIEAAIVRHGLVPNMAEAALAVRKTIGTHTHLAQCSIAPDTISLCMITKNEQKNLPRCLRNLKPIVDEIIVVDTGSTDQTKEIAAIFGASVFEFPWTGDFSAARNESIRRARGNWILVMDADEVIAPRDHASFRHLIANASEPFAGELVTRNYNTNVSLEKWVGNDGTYPDYEAGGGWIPSTKIRIFPNHRGIYFAKPVHELVDYAVKEQGIPIIELPIPIHHYGYLDLERQQQKREQYYQLGQQKLAKDGTHDLKALTELAIQAGELERYEESIELWLKTLALAPTYALAYFNLGYAYLQTGRFEEALTASKTALRLKHDYADAAINGAVAAICLEEDKEAFLLLKHIAPLGGTIPNYQLTRAVLLILNGEEPEGYDLLDKLRKEGVKFTRFINSMAKHLIGSGRLQRARHLLDLAQRARAMDDETLAIAREVEKLLD